MARIQSAGKRYVVYAAILLVLLCRPHAGKTLNCELPVPVRPLYTRISRLVIEGETSTKIVAEHYMRLRDSSHGLKLNLYHSGAGASQPSRTAGTIFRYIIIYTALPFVAPAHKCV